MPPVTSKKDEVPQKYLYKVEMTCEGCSNAVSKVLTKHKGEEIEDFSINLPEQKVVVTAGTLTSDEVTAIIQKTGKSTTFIGIEK